MHLFMCIYMYMCVFMFKLQKVLASQAQICKVCCSFSLELHECKLMDFSEGIPFQNNITERKIKPEVII